MSLLRDAWWRLGSRDAISWPTFWTTFIAGFIGGFATSAASGPLWQRVLIVILGQAMLWTPLIFARAAMNRDPQRSRPALVLSCFLTGAVLRAATTAILLWVLYGPQEVAAANRVLGIFLNLLPAFAVTAVIVSLLRERRRQISELVVTRERLQESLDVIGDSLDDGNVGAIERVRRILEDELIRLECAQAETSLVQLQRIASDIVRPMSHELAQSLPARPSDPTSLTRSFAPWTQVLDTATVGRPFRPLLVGLFISLLVLTIALRFPENAAAYTGLVVLFIVGIEMANRVVGSVNRRGTRASRIVVASTAAAAPGVCTAMAAIWLLGTAPSAVGVATGFALLATGANIGAALMTALARDRDEVIRQLRASSDALNRRLILQRQAQWYQQKALSRALHGPIQMAVTAAAIRLDAAIQAGTVELGIVDQIRTELLAGLDVLHEADGRVVTLDDGIRRMHATWEGVCSVSEHVSQDAGDILAQSGVLRSIVMDLMTEEVSNAVWHGHATHAWVRLEVTGENSDQLLLDVFTDGRGIEDAKRRGLGTQLLDECSLAWRREPSSTGDRSTAVLPFERS